MSIGAPDPEIKVRLTADTSDITDDFSKVTKDVVRLAQIAAETEDALAGVFGGKKQLAAWNRMARQVKRDFSDQRKEAKRLFDLHHAGEQHKERVAKRAEQTEQRRLRSIRAEQRIQIGMANQRRKDTADAQRAVDKANRDRRRAQQDAQRAQQKRLSYEMFWARELGKQERARIRAAGGGAGAGGGGGRRRVGGGAGGRGGGGGGGGGGRGRRSGFLSSTVRAGRVGGGIASAGFAAGAAAGRMATVPVAAAAKFASYMSRAASHSQSITSAMRNFAGNLYLAERFGFMMSVAGRAIVTPIQAAIENSQKYQDQIMGLTAHLGAYAADQTISFERMFEVATRGAERLRLKAAELPGEADDYIEVMRSAGGAMSAAGVGTFDEQIELATQAGVVGIMNQIDVQQAGRDLSNILQGRTGQRDRLFSVLKPLMGKSAKQVNAMSGPEIKALLDKALGKYTRWIEHYQNTFGAQAGALKSNFRYISEQIFGPVFDDLTQTLKDLNKWLHQNMDTFRGTGRNLVARAVEGGGAVLRGAGAVGMSAGGALKDIANNAVIRGSRAGGVSAVQQLRDRFSGAGGGKGGATLNNIGAAGMAIAAFGRMVNTATGPLRALVSPLSMFGSVFGSMFNKIAGIVGFFEGLAKSAHLAEFIEAARSTFGKIMGFADPLLTLFREVGQVVGDMVANVGTEILHDIGDAFEWLSARLAEAKPHILAFVTNMAPLAGAIWDTIKHFGSVLNQTLKPVFKAFADWFGDSAGTITTGIEDVTAGLIGALGELGFAVAKVTEFLLFLIGEVISMPGIKQLVELSGVNVDDLVGDRSANTKLGQDIISAMTGLLNNDAWMTAPEPPSAFWTTLRFDPDDFIDNKVKELAKSARNWAFSERADPHAYASSGREFIDGRVKELMKIHGVKPPTEGTFPGADAMKSMGPTFLRDLAENKKKHAQEQAEGAASAAGLKLYERLFGAPDPVGDALKSLRKSESLPEGGENPKLAGPPTVKGDSRGGTTFDFRGSRFEIEQKFSDGFDPNRIAVLMTEQMGALAQRRVGSALAPMTSVP